MALDGIFLHLLAKELKKDLVGARVDKIYQTQKVELVFSMRTRQGSYRLLMSASGNSPRLHLTSQQLENPAKPPMLCMLLRKQLQGAVLADIRQMDFDRILSLDFIAVNELGDKVERKLIIEIMAQYSNIILLDENNKIIDSVKRVDASKSSVRQVLPGLTYVLPPKQDKVDILSPAASDIVNAALEKSGRLSMGLLSTVQGMSPSLSKELVYRATGDADFSSPLTEKQGEKLLFEVENLQAAVASGTVSPQAVSDSDGKLLDFSFMPITHFGSSVGSTSYASLSELLEGFYYERERLVRIKSRAEDLFKTINNLIERLSKKLNNQILELEDCKGREEKRIKAELINANLYRLSRGVSFYELENYYEGGSLIKIEVKPELTPSENAQRYYKEYRKMRTAEEMLTGLIEQGQRDLEYLKTVLDELTRARTDREISEIRQELAQGGFIRSAGSAKKKQQPLPPLEFNAPDGFTVYVGRNNLQNDKLSLKTAAKSDLWFHVQKAPGSHVILATDGETPTEAAMEFAAKTAAYFSSKREAGSAEVDYTQVKNLKKPQGAKPGFVIYHVYSSVLVKPENPEN